MEAGGGVGPGTCRGGQDRLPVRRRRESLHREGVRQLRPAGGVQGEPGGNNGVGLRAPYEGDAAYQGMEIQVLDDPAPQYKDIKPGQHAGSIYGVFPAKQGALKPTGEWNAYEITAQGRHVTIN